MFPNLDAAAFRSSMTALERALNAVGERHKKGDLFASEGNAATLAQSVLPSDDSSLQWSSVGSGLTAAPAKQLQHLFDRLIGGYDDKQESRRTEADIWRPVREKLDQARLSSKLREKVIRSAADALEFKHAWKNGVWHCYEPVSFDLATADGIRTKARTWLGHLSAVRDAPEAFKPYFIVGAPSDRDLVPAFRDAVAILRKSPVQTEIFSEDQTDKLIAQIETDMAAEGI
jgi:hypothetical protein